MPHRKDTRGDKDIYTSQDESSTSESEESSEH